MRRGIASLTHRDFRYLAAGSLALGFGQWFQTIGLGWLILQVTGSPVQMAAVSSVRGTISVVASPLGGILSDRFHRKGVALWSTGLAALQSVVLAIVVLAGWIEMWQVYVFAAVEGIAAGVYMPARQALVFNLVPRSSLSNAVVVNSASQNLARISGPAVAGAVIGLTGTTGSAFVILTIVNLLAAALTLPIREVTGQRIAIKGEPPWLSLAEGIKYCLKDARIMGLMVMAVIPSLLVYPYVQMLPFFAQDVLHAGAAGYGLLATAVGWGSLVGLGWLMFARDIQRKGLVLLVTLFLYIAFVAAFAKSTSFELSMAFLILAGVFNAASLALTNTLFQLIVPDEFRGRVMALYNMSHGFQPLGALPMAVAIEAWGPANAVFLFVASAGAIVIVVAALSPALRRIQA